MSWCFPMRYIRRFIVVGLTVLYASIASPAEPPLSGDARKSAQIWGQFERWLDAYAKGDLESVMSIFDRQIVFLFQGAKDQGYADLRRSYEADFKTKAPGARWVPVVEEIYAREDMGIVRAIWEFRVTSANGGEEVKARNRSLDVFHLTAEGWKLLRSINYPEKS